MRDSDYAHCSRNLRLYLGICTACRDGIDHEGMPCLCCGGTGRIAPVRQPDRYPEDQDPSEREETSDS